MIILSSIQFSPKLAFSATEVSDNIARCSGLMTAAANIGSDLVVLPELAFTGYTFLDHESASNVSETWDGPTNSIMSEYAIRTNAYVAWGYVEADPTTGQLFNSSSLVSPDGETVGRHRKMNLWSTDYLWAEPGVDMPPVVDTDIGSMSVIVCRDLRNRIPKTRTASLYERRPNIVAACTNWGNGGFPSTVWMDFVAENSCVLVVANRYGVETNSGFSHDFGHGGSAIVSKDWKVNTGGLRFNDNCVVSAALDGIR